MTEFLIATLPPFGWLGWTFGGRGYPPLGKGWRREAWPIVAGILKLMAGLPWWQALLLMAAMDVAHRLPYGEEHPLWQKVMAGLAIGGCVLVASVPWYWAPLISLSWTGLFILSRRFNDVGQAYVEGLTGLLQGIALTR